MTLPPLPILRPPKPPVPHRRPAPTPPFKAGSMVGISADGLPVRETLLGSVFSPGTFRLLTAPPGAGKSLLSLAEATHMACGRSLEFGVEQTEPIPVWYWNNEDSLAEIYRRVFATTLANNLPNEVWQPNLYVNSGEQHPLTLAVQNASGAIVASDDVEVLIGEIRRLGIRVLVIDPFVETHAFDENSNEKMSRVTSIVRMIATEADCAVVVVHHTAKSHDARGNGMNASRGAGAIVGVARRVDLLLPVTDAEALSLNARDDQKGGLVKLVNTKANYGPTGGMPRYFFKRGIQLPNGDLVGAIMPVPIPEGQSEEARQNAEMEAWHTLLRHSIEVLGDQEISLNRLGILLIQQPDGPFPELNGRVVAGAAPGAVKQKLMRLAESGLDIEGRSIAVRLEGKQTLLRAVQLPSEEDLPAQSETEEAADEPA